MAGHKQVSFTVPAGSGTYATEELYLTSSGLATDIAIEHGVCQVSVVVGTIVTAAAIEVDLLKPAGDPEVAGDWLLAVKSLTPAGLQAVIELANWRGVRIRAKSGGTAGTQVVSACWR